MAQRYKVGVCTWMFGDLALPEIARRVRALGLDGVELLGDLTNYRPAETAKILQDQGLSIYSLTPSDVDPAHPDRKVRSAAVDYYLRLADFAAALHGPGQAGRPAPLVSCHGLVGRIRAISSQAEERALFVDSVRQIGEYAQPLGVRVVMEVLNRYEAHLLTTAAETLAFVAQVGLDNVSVLLDAYHMNIEESDPAGALRLAGSRLGLYHAADSNRQAIGRGHTDFEAQLTALDEIGYSGPIILECPAPGPDPFTAIKDSESLTWLETYLRESREWLVADF